MLAATDHLSSSAGRATGIPPQVGHAIAVLRGVGPVARPLDSREADALAVIYRCYGGMLLAVAKRLTNESADAEDILHDVFCRLPSLMAQYRGGGFGGWLRQIAARTALMRLRSARHRSECELLPDDERSASPAVDDSDVLHDLDAVRSAVRSLPLSLREVVILRVYLELSHDQVAAELSISKTASEVRFCRAVKLLRQAA